jgi:hypothetical protein
VLGLKFVLRVDVPFVQVAGQQGAYVARMINRGYSMGVGGMDVAPPVKVDPALGEVRELAHGRMVIPVEYACFSSAGLFLSAQVPAALQDHHVDIACG